jgi:uncharacterized membrane protein YkgB
VMLDRVVTRAGRRIALTGVVLPLLLIGVSKFAAFEVEALKPLVSGAPWLVWMYTMFGPVNTARLMGIVEIITALLLIASVWVPRAGVVGGAIAGVIFFVTLSLLASVPIWEAGPGGLPALNGAGQFLIKDVALLGISLVVLGESLGRRRE